jgi:hypothetical protein
MPNPKSKVEWDKKNFIPVTTKFHRKNDADIIAAITTPDESRQQRIKTLIRKALKETQDQ